MIRSDFLGIIEEYESQLKKYGLNLKYKIMLNIDGHLLEWPLAGNHPRGLAFTESRELRWDNKEAGVYYWTGTLSPHQQTINELIVDNLLTKIRLLIKSYHTLDCGMGVLNSAVKAIEAKDRYTRGHSDRVAALSLKIAGTLHEAGLLDREFSNRDIEIAAKLHDIGKIGISELILTKTGALTMPEIQHIRQHPAMGAVILTPLTIFEHLIPAIRHHHERFDGNGYPDGLRGSEIPLISRIISVADTFDALTSNRPYRKAMDPPTALAEIRRVRGTQLDPDIVGAFLSIPDNRFLPLTISS